MSDLTPIIIDQFSVDEEAFTLILESIEEANAACASLAAVIRPIRKRIGWSQAALAEHLAIPTNRLTQIEKGDLPLMIDDALVVARWVSSHAPLQRKLPTVSGDPVESFG